MIDLVKISLWKAVFIFFLAMIWRQEIYCDLKAGTCPNKKTIDPTDEANFCNTIGVWETCTAASHNKTNGKFICESLGVAKGKWKRRGKTETAIATATGNNLLASNVAKPAEKASKKASKAAKKTNEKTKEASKKTNEKANKAVKKVKKMK